MIKCECPEWDQEHNLAPYNDICVACGKPIIQKGGNKMEKENKREAKKKSFAEIKSEKAFDRFYQQLKSAICLAGGDPNREWNKFTLERVFTTLHKNGVYLCFRIEPEKFYSKVFGPEDGI